MQHDGNRLIESNKLIVGDDVFGQVAEEPQAPHCQQQTDSQMQPQVFAWSKAPQQPTQLPVVAFP
jgi:hypothetical protein